MNSQKTLNTQRNKRQARTRAKLLGTSQRPRIAVFRSNSGISAQLIDDESLHTLAAVSTVNLSAQEKKKTKVEQAVIIGEQLSKKAKELGISAAVFDRRSYKYHGRVKALADAARNSGLVF